MSGDIIKKHADDFFNTLILKFGFKVKSEIVSDEFYLMEYVSESYVIKLENYFRELYTTVYSLSKQDKEVNLFNLLEFLKRNDAEVFDAGVPDSDYFLKEKNLEECYKKQLNHISSIIYDNLDLLGDFFSKDKVERNILEFDSYWKSKYPELYRTL